MHDAAENSSTDKKKQKRIRKGRRWTIITIVSILLLGSVTFALWQVMNSRTFQFFGTIISHVDTKEKVVALTFDDGPSPTKVDPILDTLRSEQVQATFFLIGQELERNPEAGKKIVANGHEPGNHTYSHQRMVLKSYSFIQEEIEKTDSLIRQTGYQGTIYFRPPNGKKLFLLPFYLSQHQRTTITWDLEPETEVGYNADQVATYTLTHAHPGAIILLHPWNAYNEHDLVSMLQKIIQGLHQQGYTFKTVSDLLSLT